MGKEVNFMKFKNWLDIWLEKYVKHSVKPRTYINYGGMIEKHIKPKLGDYELEELSPLVLQNFMLEEIEHGNLKTGGYLATNTVVILVNLLKLVIGQAKVYEVTDKDNTGKIRCPFIEATKVTAFERDEQEKLEKYCLRSKKTNHLGIVVCLYTGLRIGELLALCWSDIDFKNGIMSISKAAYQANVTGKFGIVVDTPKTKTSTRLIPLPKNLVALLRVAKKNSKSKYVISTRTGGMVGTRSYQKTFELIQKKLHIPHKNFHALRHTFATRALEVGMDVKTVSEILGHKNPLITLSRYAHSLMSHKRMMMNKLAKTLVAS